MKDREAVLRGGMESEPQESLVAAMKEARFYPKPPEEVTHKETHISHLFFAGELVYKIKKAVRFPFLDYSTLARRRFFLNEELRLNRRLAPSVYLGVMPISYDEAGWRLGGWTEPAEYTLVMRRLPEKRMLPFLLETHQVTPEMMGELAQVVANFHAGAEGAKGIELSRWPATVAAQWKENLNEVEPLAGVSIDSESLSAIADFGAKFLDSQTELLRRRAQGGWIRDVHGDLHCDHVCFAPEGIQIFDCIEFNPKRRFGDLAAEVAFLLMDLSVRGAESMATPFLRRYRELIDDPELPSILPFYQCYRALVRGKVQALRPEGAAAAARYFQYAARLTWQPLQPFVVILCGLTGSGKSTLAGELGRRLGLRVINSDIVRKKMVNTSAHKIVPLNQGIYTPAITERTYARMAHEAEKEILAGNGVILDATYGQRANREKLVRLVEKHGVPWSLIHCFASDEIIQQRLTQRAAQGTDISDGRWEIYVEQKRLCEPISEISSEARLELNTEASLDQLARSCEKFLRSRLGPERG
ncbi:MAG: AAA family ATPase [Deltaproteobacteria bacterium]|nr:AAA family ATPase [Deltaproteobacteria bacterium]